MICIPALRRKTYRELLTTRGPVPAQARGLPREHISQGRVLLARSVDGLPQGTQQSRGKRREPLWGRRPHGGVGLGAYPGGVSIADRARDTQTDEIVALKKVRMDKEKDGERGGAAGPL